MQITDYTVRKLVVPIDPPISDSQFEFDTVGIAYLELETDTGKIGIGFSGTSPSQTVTKLEDQFSSVFADLVGKSPFHLTSRFRRPRGGQYGDTRFGGVNQTVDIALWDLCGKHLGMPLYRLFGGTDPQVPAYVSGLHFSLDDTATSRHFEQYAEQGFDAVKVKVGYPTIDEDIHRLELVKDAMGADVTLMIDANEAWSPKQAIRRMHAYKDAGIDVYWIEDPVLRDDVSGCRRVSDAVPFAYLNSGEYLNFEGKLELLEERASDIVHLAGGYFSTARQEVALASAFGIPVALHDTMAHVGVHLAAAVPEITYQEYWPRPWDSLTETGIEVGEASLTAPDDPGHGVRFSTKTFQEYGTD